MNGLIIINTQQMDQTIKRVVLFANMKINNVLNIAN